MTKYYVSDSRSLDTEGPLTLEQAVEWLEEKSEDHGRDKDDWRNTELWGMESGPELYTEAEWFETLEGK